MKSVFESTPHKSDFFFNIPPGKVQLKDVHSISSLKHDMSTILVMGNGD